MFPNLDFRDLTVGQRWGEAMGDFVVCPRARCIDCPDENGVKVGKARSCRNRRATECPLCGQDTWISVGLDMKMKVKELLGLSQ